MKKSLLAPILFIAFALPVLIHAQETASCDFDYGTYTEYTPMPVISSSPAIGLIDGKIYLTGGSDFTDYEKLYTPDHLQVYDPDTDSWDTTGARLPVPRSIYGGGDMALDGKLYAIGGIDWVNLGGGDWQMIPHARVDVYDPLLDTWEMKQNLPLPIGGKAVCSLNDKLYVTGGISTDQVALNSLHCYDPGTDQWTELSGMKTPRLFHVAIALDGKIYAISGAGSDIMTATNTCEVYDPDLDQWTSIAPLPGTSVFGAACAVDREIYVFGGSPTGPANPSRLAYKYNPEMDVWIEIDHMKTASKEHVLVPIGRTIHIFGLSTSNTGFVHSYELSDIRLDAMIPDDTIDGDVIELDLSEHFSHVNGGEITYSACIDEQGVVEASIDGSMLTVTGLMLDDEEISILAESGEDKMGSAFKVNVESITIGIEGICEIPPALTIYPNPARSTSTLQYSVQSPGVVRLEIFDLLGKRKAILLNEHKGFGDYEFQCSTQDWESGIYFCNLVTATKKATVKLIVEH